MTTVNLQLIIHYVLIISIEKFHDTKAQIRYGNYENKSVPNIRQIYYTNHLSGENSKGNHFDSSTDLPVDFKAPDLSSENYWNYNRHNFSNGRIFLGDFGYFGHRKANLPDLNNFYNFMHSFIDKGTIFKESETLVPKPISEPYPYEYPFNVYSTTERNFLPPPKPIRASIVKLETVTRGPEAFIYINPPRQASNFRPISIRKPYFNSFHIDELGFHSDRDINFESEPYLYPQNSEVKSHILDKLNSTIYMPSSAEVNLQKIKMPFGTEGERAPSTHLPPLWQVSTTENIIDRSRTESNSDAAALEPVSRMELLKYNKSNGIISDKESTGRESKNETLVKRNKLENITDVINMNEKRNGNEEMSLKKFKSDKMTNSIKIVTELTLEGLSKNKKEMANIPILATYTKFINMSGLINYELNKLKQNKIMKPRWDVSQENNMNESSITDRNYIPSPSVNADDELSLDFKILKDTNWDGFTTEISSVIKSKSIVLNSTAEYGNSKQFFIEDGNDSSEILHNQNNTIKDRKSYDNNNNNNNNNNTIIIETRVTKSITKAIPILRDQIIKNDTVSKNYFILKNQKSSERNNFKSEGSEVNLNNEEEKSYPLIMPIYRKSAENYKFSNKTVQIEEKNGNQSVEVDLIHDVNKTELFKIIPIATTITNESKVMVDNFFKINKTGLVNPKNIDNEGAVDLEDNKHSKNFNNYTIYTSTPRGEAIRFENKTNDGIIKQLRKRKRKKMQKNKRRRTGKRREKNSIATEVNIITNRNVS